MKTTSPFLILLLALAIAQPTAAALGDHLMSVAFPVGSGESGLVIDGSSNLVVHGTFFGTIDLGGGPMTSVNFLDGDQYLARFDANGNHLWSVQYSPAGPGASYELAAVDAAGNIYITGSLFNSTTIDYGGGTLNGPGMYIAKFNSSGVHQWSALYGAGTPRAIAADNANVVVAGYTSTGLDFGGGTVGNAGGNDAFVAQFTSAGAHAWSAGFGDADDQGAMDVAIDPSGNVLLAGSMEGTVDFGGGGLTANLLDMFVAKFNSSGAHQWSQVFDGLFTPGGGILVEVNIAAGPSNEVAVAGEFRNSVDFGGGTLTSNGFSDIYLAAFNAAGAHQWSASYGTLGGSDKPTDVSIDGAGNVLMCGDMADDMDLGGGTVSFVGDPLNFDRNIYLALYEGSGAHLFSNAFGPKANQSSCGFDAGDQIVISGRGGTSIDLGGGPLSPADYFVARFEGAAGPPTGIGDIPASTKHELRAYPNPFNPTTTIDYTVHAPATVTVAVYDARGRLIEEVVSNRWHGAGRYAVAFEAAASGVYFARMQVGASQRVVKMVAVK